jgi:hypothetical protein
VSIPVYTGTWAPEQLEILAGHVGFLPTVVLKDVLARAMIKDPYNAASLAKALLRPDEQDRSRSLTLSGGLDSSRERCGGRLH